MAASKKKTKPEVETEAPAVVETKPEITPVAETKPEITPVVKTKARYKVGSIVFVSDKADADLNGFKLFPQYKKYTYTVEAYDEATEVYTLRKLNLALRLKEADIVSPEEHAHDPLNRRQY